MSEKRIGRERRTVEQSKEDKVPAVPKVRHDVAALFISDVHISARRPVVRSLEEDWLQVIAGYFDQVVKLQMKYCCPLFIVGDLFDSYDPGAYAVNEAMRMLPTDTYAIAGNHDLPFHSYRELPKSAYWTLVEAGKIKNLSPGGSQYVETSCGTGLTVTPFPYGFEPHPCKEDNSLSLNVALVHDYIWTKSTGHAQAPKAKRYAKWIKKLEGYDVAVFGDNHRGFLIQSDDKVTILNCGTFLRRTIKEIDYSPVVGVLHANGTVTRHKLDTSKDKFSSLHQDLMKIENKYEIDLSDFLQELDHARATGLDWNQTLKLYCEKNALAEPVRRIIIASLSGTEK